MFEQDYVMRLIHEMARVILKLLFDIDSPNPTAEVIENQEVQSRLNQLLELVEQGNIEEAENRLYDLTCDHDREYLKMGVLFYSYLNDKDDDFLAEHHFSREEIKDGFKGLTSRYGIDGISDVFLM